MCRAGLAGHRIRQNTGPLCTHRASSNTLTAAGFIHTHTHTHTHAHTRLRANEFVGQLHKQWLAIINPDIMRVFMCACVPE